MTNLFYIRLRSRKEFEGQIFIVGKCMKNLNELIMSIQDRNFVMLRLPMRKGKTNDVLLNVREIEYVEEL